MKDDITQAARDLALSAQALNLIDAVLTLHLIETSGLTEGSPVMARSLSVSAGVFLAAKLIMGGGGIYILEQAAIRHRRKLAVWALLAVVSVLGVTVLLSAVSVFYLDPAVEECFNFPFVRCGVERVTEWHAALFSVWLLFCGFLVVVFFNLYPPII